MERLERIKERIWTKELLVNRKKPAWWLFGLEPKTKRVISPLEGTFQREENGIETYRFESKLMVMDGLRVNKKLQPMAGVITRTLKPFVIYELKPTPVGFEPKIWLVGGFVQKEGIVEVEYFKVGKENQLIPLKSEWKEEIALASKNNSLKILVPRFNLSEVKMPWPILKLAEEIVVYKLHPAITDGVPLMHFADGRVLIEQKGMFGLARPIRLFGQLFYKQEHFLGFGQLEDLPQLLEFGMETGIIDGQKSAGVLKLWGETSLFYVVNPRLIKVARRLNNNFPLEITDLNTIMLEYKLPFLDTPATDRRASQTLKSRLKNWLEQIYKPKIETILKTHANKTITMEQAITAGVPKPHIETFISTVGLKHSPTVSQLIQIANNFPQFKFHIYRFISKLFSL